MNIEKNQFTLGDFKFLQETLEDFSDFKRQEETSGYFRILDFFKEDSLTRGYLKEKYCIQEISSFFRRLQVTLFT